MLHAQNDQLTPSDFGAKASAHVKKLCDFGVRIAGSDAEKNTVVYLVEKFKENGMDVSLDTIIYKDYTLENRSVFLNGKKIPIKSAFINKPFENIISVESRCMILQNDYFDINNVTDKIIFSLVSNHSIALSKYNPKAVIVMDKNNLEALDIKDEQNVTVKFVGASKSKWTKSYNIIATYKKKMPVDSSIILTAHWDSQNGVGADDNASGTACLIELSNFFSKRLNDLKYNLVFVATGLEEFGMLGSISYVFNNIESVDKCILNFNIDGIALDMPRIEVSHINYNNSQSDTIQDILVFEKKSPKGILMTTREEIYFNRICNTSQTERLSNTFKNSMTELGIEYKEAGCCAGVDARSFNYIGIPYINFGSSNSESNDHVVNTPQDVFNESFVENINNNGRIASKILIDINE
jgi:hypothetical protein